MAPICIFSVFSVQYSVYSVFCIFSVQCILTSLLRSCVSRAPASILLHPLCVHSVCVWVTGRCAGVWLRACAGARVPWDGVLDLMSATRAAAEEVHS